MKKEKADRKISVRLNDEANKKVIDAVNKGISKSEFINNAIIGCNTTNIGDVSAGSAQPIWVGKKHPI